MKYARPLTINLETARNASAFDDDTLLFPDRLEQVREMIETHLERIQQEHSVGDCFNDHSSIFVDGARGAGKTSFVLTLGDRLRRKDGQDDWAIAKEVHVLQTLDPTLLEEHEVFLAQVVANVLSSLEGHLEDRGCRRNRDDDWKAIEGPLSKLSRSFRVLLPDGGKRAWDRVVSDPDLLGDELLSAAMSGIHLAERMHEFLVKATEVMGVKAFVQPIDDVDTAVEQGWPVLETTRRYLSSDRMITVLTGDLRLYRMMVRHKQWKKLGQLVEAESRIKGAHGGGVTEERLHSYGRQVDLLVDQYLLKVLPPALRVRLPGARERMTGLDKYFSEVNFIVPKVHAKALAEPSRPLVNVLENAWRVLFARPRKVVGRQILDPQTFPPARLLSTSLRKLNRGLEVLARVALCDAEDPETHSQARATIARFAEVYDSELTVLGIEQTLIRSLLEGEGTVRLATWAHRLVERHPEAWRLDTRSLDETPEDEALAATLLMLQAALNLHLQQHPLHIYQLLGRLLVPGQHRTMVDNNVGDGHGDWLANLRLQADEPSWKTPARVVNPSVRELGGTLRLGQMRLPRRLNKPHRKRSLMLAYGRSQGESERDKIGFLPWWKITKTAGTQPEAYEVLPATETFERRADKRTLLVLNWFSVRYLVIAQPYDVLDFWAGIAKLGDLAAGARTSANVTTVQALARAADESPIYQKGQTPNDSEDDPGDEDTAEVAGHWSSKLESTDDFVAAIVTWLSHAQGEHAPGMIGGHQVVPPVPVMGSIVRKTYDALAKVTENMTGNRCRLSAGAVLQLWVAAWLQSVLVGEVQYRSQWPGEGPLDARGIASATDVLDGNLTKLTRAEKLAWQDLPFFYQNLACPLLLATMGEDLRDRALEVLRKASKDEDSGWRAMIDKILEKCVFEAKWDPATPGDHWSSTIYEQLCALVPAPTSDSKGAKTLTKNQYQKAKSDSGFDWEGYFDEPQTPAPDAAKPQA